MCLELADRTIQFEYFYKYVQRGGSIQVFTKLHTLVAILAEGVAEEAVLLLARTAHTDGFTHAASIRMLPAAHSNLLEATLLSERRRHKT